MISDDCEMFTILIAGGWGDPSDHTPTTTSRTSMV